MSGVLPGPLAATASVMTLAVAQPSAANMPLTPRPPTRDDEPYLAAAEHEHRRP